MVQLQILSGKMAGTLWVARRFPVRIGRDPANDLRLEDDGVWPRHLELSVDPANRFTITAQTDALLTVNHQSVRTANLRNGDSITLGSVQLQFWLAETRQRGVRGREWFVWALIAAICASQIALVYWLLQ